MNRALRVFVMLSGGVDSSVAAARLVDSGYAVEGIFMRNWSFDRLSDKSADFLRRSCSTHEDEAYARAVATHLRIPFQSVSFEQQYWDLVVEPFFNGIAKGYTPNPDVWCNQYIKYGVFLDWALAHGADVVASGHYARLRRANLKFKIKNLKLNKNYELKIENYSKAVQLMRGVDPAKDQSYFLVHVPTEKLARALFPIGHLYKSQVRAEAFARGLPTATKKDSQGICFIGKIPLKEFLKERFPEKKGDILDGQGNVIGQHDGAWFYTIGERLGITNSKLETLNSKKNQSLKLKTLNLKLASSLGLSASNLPPLYIIDKDIQKNILVVGEDDGSEPLWKKELCAGSWNFFEMPRENEVYEIEIRYHQTPKSVGKILQIPRYKKQDTNKLQISNFKFQILLREPVRAVTPGQTVVVSKGDRIIGAGIIVN